jgi:hypothetical protein
MSWFSRKRPAPPAARPARLGQPAMSDQDVVGAALLCPHFGPYLTTWRLTISQDGMLRQEVNIPNPGNRQADEWHHEELGLPAEELAAIVAIAERIGFRNFHDRYEDRGVTDQEDLWIAVHLPEGLKIVRTYGAIGRAGRHNDPDMLGFLELWARIHRFAPFSSPYNQPDGMVAAEARRQAHIEQVIALEQRRPGIVHRWTSLFRRRGGR